MPVTDLFMSGVNESISTAVTSMIDYYNNQLDVLGGDLVQQIGDSLGKPVRAIPLNIFKSKEIPIIRVPDRNASMAIRRGKKTIVERQNFILTSVNRARREQYQVFQTFDSYIVDFYGEAPQVYSIAGSVVTRAGEGGNWLKDLELFYSDSIRGGKLAQSGDVIELHYASVTLIGYAVAFTITENESAGDIANFSMVILIRDTIYDPDIIITSKKSK